MAALEDVKAQLRVTHDLDDVYITRLISAALAEYVNFTNLSGDDVPGSADDLAPDAFNGIVLMVQADYDGDPEKRMSYRRSAHVLWFPYRVDMGV